MLAPSITEEPIPVSAEAVEATALPAVATHEPSELRGSGAARSKGESPTDTPKDPSEAERIEFNVDIPVSIQSCSLMYRGKIRNVAYGSIT